MTEQRVRTRAILWKKQKGRCAKCGVNMKMPPGGAVPRGGFDANVCTLDHIIPKARGGTMRRENCRLLCYGCNQERQDAHDPAEFSVGVIVGADMGPGARWRVKS